MSHLISITCPNKYDMSILHNLISGETSAQNVSNLPIYPFISHCNKPLYTIFPFASHFPGFSQELSQVFLSIPWCPRGPRNCSNAQCLPRLALGPATFHGTQRVAMAMRRSQSCGTSSRWKLQLCRGFPSWPWLPEGNISNIFIYIIYIIVI